MTRKQARFRTGERVHVRDLPGPAAASGEPRRHGPAVIAGDDGGEHLDVVFDNALAGLPQPVPRTAIQRLDSPIKTRLESTLRRLRGRRGP